MHHHPSRLLVVIGSLALVVAGCGPKRAPRTALPTVPIHLTAPQSFLNTPLYLAERLGLFAHNGIAVNTQSPRAGLTIGPLPRSRTVIGVVAQKSDEFLIAPSADPHFRLNQLSTLPVAYIPSHPQVRTLMDAIFALHEVKPPLLQALAVSQIPRLWAHGQIPYLVAPLPVVVSLTHSPHPAHILATFAASTGNIPAWVVSGTPGAHQAAVLEALNVSLWYLRSHSPHQVSAVLAGVNGWNQGTWRKILRTSQPYHFWPASTYPSRPPYQRWQALVRLLPHAPVPAPYEKVVDTEAATAAMAMTR